MKKLRREFHSRSKAFACLLTMCAGFSDAYTFIERGGTLAAGQTGNVVFLSVGLIGHEISDVEVKLATMLAFMIGIFLMTVFQRFFSHSVWRLSTLVPLVLTTLVAGFLPKEVPNVLIVPFFGLSLGIVAISFGEVDGYAYNHSFMTGNLKKTMVAYGNFVRDRKMEFFWESLFDWEFCRRGYSFNLPHPILWTSDHLVCFPCSDHLSDISGDSICSERRLNEFLQSQGPCTLAFLLRTFAWYF